MSQCFHFAAVIQATVVAQIHGAIFTAPIGWKLSSALFARGSLDFLLLVSLHRVDHANDGEVRGQGGGSGGGGVSLEHGLITTLGANDARRRSFGEWNDAFQAESVGMDERNEDTFLLNLFSL